MTNIAALFGLVARDHMTYRVHMTVTGDRKYGLASWKHKWLLQYWVWKGCEGMDETRALINIAGNEAFRFRRWQKLVTMIFTWRTIP